MSNSSAFVLVLVLFLISYCSAVGNKSDKSNWLYKSDYRKVETEMIENIHTEYKSSICDLHRSQKAMICKKLFERIEYSRYRNLFLNKTAFFNVTPECVPKRLLFAFQRHLNSEIHTQKMYPCFGRNNPMRSGFDLDDYYDAFYVSGDREQRILFVYERVLSPDFVYYRPVALYERVNFDVMLPLLIGEIEVQKELQTMQTKFRTTNVQEIETIYLRGASTSTASNMICNLNRLRKIALCRIIFEKVHYWKKYFGLNVEAFFDEEPQCTENSLAFLHWTHHNKNGVKQSMLPCFGKYLKENEPWQNDNFLKQFSISSGPRKNSVFAYFQLGGKDSNVYHVYEFIENIHFESIHIHGKSESEFDESELAASLKSMNDKLSRMTLIDDEYY